MKKNRTSKRRRRGVRHNGRTQRRVGAGDIAIVNRDPFTYDGEFFMDIFLRIVLPGTTELCQAISDDTYLARPRVLQLVISDGAYFVLFGNV